MDSAGLLADEAGLEENLRATKALITDFHHLAIRHLVGLFLIRALLGCLQFCVEVQGDVAKLLLKVAHDLTLRCGSEGVAALCENLHEILCKVAARKIKTLDCMWQCIALIDWHSVGDAIARV